MNEIIFWNAIWGGEAGNVWTTRSIGPYQLSHWLRKNNVESQIIDFCQWMSAQEIFRFTSKFISSKTKYIGISGTFIGTWILRKDGLPPKIVKAIELVRKRYPHLKIIIGGKLPMLSRQAHLVDMVMLGEAEDSLLTLLKGHNLSPKFNITQLNHRFHHKDCIIEGEVLPIELGRGCIFKCKFCGHSNTGKPKYTYQRHISHIEDEIVYNYENFKTTKYLFLDDTVNEDKEKIYNLSKIPSNTGIDLIWNGYLRLDLLKIHGNAEQIFQSGMRSCYFGIESFHKQASQAIGKGWNGKYAKDYLPILYKDIWNEQVNMACNYIVGLPGEDLDSLYDTLDWCMDNPIGFHHFNALSLHTNMQGDELPRSEFATNYKDYGYELLTEGGGEWKSSIMTQDMATKISTLFNNELKSINRYSGWMLFDFINGGSNLEEVRHVSFKNAASTRQRCISSFRTNFMTSYKAALSSL